MRASALRDRKICRDGAAGGLEARRRAATRFAGAALAALLLLPGAARAADAGPDTLPIHVVAIQTDDANDQAEALTKALRGAVRGAAGWSLGEGDFSLEVLILNLKCSEPPDASCQSRVADQIKADRYVWGSLKKKGPNVVGELNLWVRGKGTAKVPITYSANLTEGNDDSLRKVAIDSLLQLTGGPPKGVVHVKAGSIAAQVFVDGQPIGALTAGDGAFPIAAGPHRIVVKALGYGDVETQVVVRPNNTAEVSVSPIRAEPKSQVSGRRVAGFVGLGLGAVFGGLGLMSSLQVNGVQNDSSFKTYRMADQASPDRCADAATSGSSPNASVASLCDKAHSFQTMQYAFYPLAVVGAGAGIYLLATSSGGAAAHPKTGLTVDPQLGPSGGKLDVSYRW